MLQVQTYGVSSALINCKSKLNLPFMQIIDNVRKLRTGLMKFDKEWQPDTTRVACTILTVYIISHLLTDEIVSLFLNLLNLCV